MKRIKYLAQFTTPDNEDNRYAAPSACTKIDYIARSIASNNINVEIISGSNSVDKSYKEKTIVINEHLAIKYMRAFSRGGFIKNKISTLLFRWNLFNYLLMNIKRDDVLIVYHSMDLLSMVYLLKKLIKFKLIIEAEEIYGNVKNNHKQVSKEMKYFRIADGYIFPTELLNKRINVENKPYLLVHGTYKSEKLDSFKKKKDGKIHCVYAGTFNANKGGADIAIQVARYLPENYHVHILGFGKEAEQKRIHSLIELTRKVSKCTVSFDGCLSGKEYNEFLQGCDIGLSTQNPEGAYNDTSFPSKILSYMANGLRVVCVRIPAVETSAVNESVYYYDCQSISDIADIISKIDINDNYDGYKIIESLDFEFKFKMKSMLEYF